MPFYLLLPDPNLNGLDAPADDPPSDPAAAALYGRAMEAYTSVHRVRYAQSMASHTGSVSYGVHVVNDGADGSTPGFTYDAPGGWQYVVLGTTSWSRRPGQPWTVREANPMIPPARWDDEYMGATGFRLGRVEELNGEPCQLLTFVVPGTGRQVVAWYVWWVGTESGRVHREMMISQSHYMLTDFSTFRRTAADRPARQAFPRHADLLTISPIDVLLHHQTWCIGGRQGWFEKTTLHCPGGSPSSPGLRPRPPAPG